MKPDKDFSKEADKQIPEAQELAKVNLSTIWSRLAEVNGLAARKMSN